MEKQTGQTIKLGCDRLGSAHLVHHHQGEAARLVMDPHQVRRVLIAGQGERFGAAHLALGYWMRVVGVAQPMAWSAALQ